jgi:hypothetical protein
LSPVPAVLLAVPAAVVGQLDDGAEPTATVLPHASTGAATGAFAVLPEPSVAFEVPPEPVPDDPASVLPPLPVPLLGKPMATELPVTLTGAFAGAFAVLSVLPAVPLPVSTGQPAVGAAKMPIEVPHTVTGALTGAFADGSVAAFAMPAPMIQRPPIRKPACMVRFNK